MTLLERFNKMVADAWVIGHKEEIEEIRCELAIAQAAREIRPTNPTVDWIMQRAEELLAAKEKP